MLAPPTHHEGVTTHLLSDDLVLVQRWETTGGEVEILDWGPPIVVALCTCDGGQEMQRIVSWEADVRTHLGP